MVSVMIVCELLYEIACIRSNAKTSTTAAVAKWRQQQAYMIQSSYSEGSAVKRCTIDAYLKKNCYIQVLQTVNTKQASTVVADVTSTVSTVDSAAQHELMNSIKADMTRSQSSIVRALQLLVSVMFTSDEPSLFLGNSGGATMFTAIFVADMLIKC
jgi:hypothetical protein